MGEEEKGGREFVLCPVGACAVAVPVDDDESGADSAGNAGASNGAPRGRLEREPDRHEPVDRQQHHDPRRHVLLQQHIR